MAYAQIDVGAMRHPKILQLSADAFRLWVAGLCYCQEHLTDGVLVAPVLSVLGAPVLPQAIEELLTARLWERLTGPAPGTPGGYAVHDYLTWNKSREQVEKEKTAARTRAERSRQIRKARADRKAERQLSIAKVRRTCGAQNAHGAEPIRSDTKYVQDQDPRPPAGRPTAEAQDLPANPSLVRKLTHELLDRQPYEFEADLKEDVKRRCAAFRVAYDSDAVRKALDAVEATRARREARAQ